MNTECFGITILIEIPGPLVLKEIQPRMCLRVITTLDFDGYRATVVSPKLRQDAIWIPNVRESEVGVDLLSFPLGIVFVQGKRRGRIEKCLEADQIGKRSYSQIEHDVHSTSVHLVDRVSPDLESSTVSVQHGVVCW